MDWLTAHKLPIGATIEDLVDWLIDHAGWLFDAISTGLGYPIDGLVGIMQAVPPLALVALFAALAYWLHRSLGLVVMVVVSLLLIMNLGYWAETSTRWPWSSSRPAFAC